MDSTKAGDPTQPRKRARIDCLIHCSDDDTDSMVTLKDHDSWKTLLRAAEIRQQIPVLDFAKDLDEDEVSQIQYDWRCGSIIRMKKALDLILSKGATSSVEPAEGTYRRSEVKLQTKCSMLCMQQNIATSEESSLLMILMS